VKIRWVDEDLWDSEAAMHACGGSGRLSCNGVKGINCSMDVATISVNVRYVDLVTNYENICSGIVMSWP